MPACQQPRADRCSPVPCSAAVPWMSNTSIGSMGSFFPSWDVPSDPKFGSFWGKYFPNLNHVSGTAAPHQSVVLVLWSRGTARPLQWCLSPGLQDGASLIFPPQHCSAVCVVVR